MDDAADLDEFEFAGPEEPTIREEDLEEPAPELTAEEEAEQRRLYEEEQELPDEDGMPLFSNNPGLERMMQQKPAGRRAPKPPALPPDHPCYGCNYGMGRRCVGVCYKELLSKRRKRE